MDATIINAPSSTKNAAGKRDPEMHQTKKGNLWYHGMKIHAGQPVVRQRQSRYVRTRRTNRRVCRGLVRPKSGEMT